MRITSALIVSVLVLAGPQDDARALVEQLKAIIAKLEQVLRPQEPIETCVEPAQFQAALDGTAAVVRMCPGATYGPSRIRRNGVRVTTLGVPALTTRVTPQEAAGFAVVTATGNLAAFDVTGSQVAIDNVAINGAVDTHVLCGHADSSQTTREQQPTDVTLTRLYMDGAGAKRGVGAHCRNLTVEKSHLFSYKRVGQDTQAIGGWNGEGPFRILDNFLEGAGENVMFGGAAPAIPGLIPRDVTIRGNLFTKRPEWRATGMTVKNLLEFKVVSGAVVEDNVFENVWQCASVCQNGYAIVLTPQAQDAPNPNAVVENVTIRRNQFRDVAAGINLIGRAQIGTSLPGCGFAIEENWVRITKGFNGGASQGWFLFLNNGPCNVAVRNNTIESDSNQIVFHQGDPVLQFVLTGNLVPRTGAYGMTLNGGQHRGAGIATAFPGGVLTGNAFGRVLATATNPSQGLIPSNLPGNLHMETSAMLPLVVGGYGTGVLAPYGRRP